MFLQTNCELTMTCKTLLYSRTNEVFRQEKRMLCEITRWKRINSGTLGRKYEWITLNDVCMYFVTRIIVDLSSCVLPRPSLATEFKASIYKEWTNAMAAPTRRIGSECIYTRMHSRYACGSRGIPYCINAIHSTADGLLFMRLWISRGKDEKKKR